MSVNHRTRPIRVPVRFFLVLIYVHACAYAGSFMGQAHATENKPDCTGPAAVKSVTYKVDGQTVPSLQGKSGSTLEIAVEPTDQCKDTKFGLAVYSAPGPVWNPDVASKQQLASLARITEKTPTLKVKVPDCYFQLDFFTGSVLYNLGKEVYGSRLIASDNGGEKACGTAKPQVTTTTVAAKPSEVTTTTIPQTSAQRPTTTTVAVATPEQIETTGEVNADDSVQPVQFVTASQPTELAYTGARTTFFALLGAFRLCRLPVSAKRPRPRSGTAYDLPAS
jgi:hypothetical protein